MLLSVPCALLLSVVLVQAGTASSPPPAQLRDRSFWVGIADRDFAVPEGMNAFALLLEMNELLGSPDPVLRDRVAYGAAARWIYRQRLLTPPQQTQVLAMWTRNLEAGLGERTTDSIFRRSFSALNLSILAALDNEAPFLSAQEHKAFVDRALAYFEAERDRRGYDPAKGWMHAAAHTADLLKFLARSPKLTSSAQARMLEAISQKCARFGEVFQWGEDERIAQVIRSIARRPDLDRPAFERWLAGPPVRYRELWARAPSIDPGAFAEVQNLKLVLRAAYVALSLDPNLPQNTESVRRLLGDTLAKMP
jgi:hypothetical protein